jgi:16S rRNA A1518/A1519 N6-dimethyltransferase RsmA/KsgA/DIM1 with predicted DNA glycosylase/AP lyase activity
MDKKWHELGQHKLLSPEIFDEFIEKTDKLIEIGAGEGAITKRIARKNNNSLAFEIDTSFKDGLKKIEGVRIVIADALKYDWRGYNKIVSNLPFHLAEPVIKKAMIDDISDLIILVSEKTRYKLMSEEEFGWVVKKFYRTQVVSEILPENFDPEPKTTSWLMRLTRIEKQPLTGKIIINIYVSKGKIKNAIIKSLQDHGMTKREARAALSRINLLESIEKPCNKATIPLLKKIGEELKKL